MSEIIFEFEETFPKDLKPMIEKLLDELIWIFPLWMQRVGIAWDAREGDKTAELRLFKDYRQCQLMIFPLFMDESEYGQCEVLIHEIIHCFTVPMKTNCFEVMEDVLSESDDKIKLMAERQIDRVMEQVTQDFAFSIARRYKVDFAGYTPVQRANYNHNSKLMFESVKKKKPKQVK